MKLSVFSPDDFVVGALRAERRFRLHVPRPQERHSQPLRPQRGRSFPRVRLPKCQGPFPHRRRGHGEGGRVRQGSVGVHRKVPRYFLEHPPYDKIVKDPIGAARSIYSFSGREFKGDIEENMRNHALIEQEGEAREGGVQLGKIRPQ